MVEKKVAGRPKTPRDSEKPELLLPVTIGITKKEGVLTKGFLPESKIPADIKAGDSLEDSKIDAKTRWLLRKQALSEGVVVVGRTEEQVRINEALKRRGVPTEEVMDRMGDGTNQYMLKVGARSLRLMENHELKQMGWEKIVGGVADVVSSFHTLNLGEGNGLNACVHGHPHTGNITFDGKAFGAIDMKLAKRVSVDWTDAKSVFKAFNKDYAKVNQGLAELAYKMDDERRLRDEKFKHQVFGKAMKRMLSAYPVEEGVRGHVFELMEHFGYTKGVVQTIGDERVDDYEFRKQPRKKTHWQPPRKVTSDFQLSA